MMMSRHGALLAAVCVLWGMPAAGAAQVRTINGLPQIKSYEFKKLDWVPRLLKKEPAYASKKVRYCIWVLGDGHKSVMTMAWDESGGTGTGYDTLYVDRDFDADLTEEGERYFYANVTKQAKTRGQPYERYEVTKVKEAGGDRVFDFHFRNVYSSDEIEYNSRYRMRSQMRSPKLSYDVGPLPGNHKILWSTDLKTAPVYHFGGEAVPVTNGKLPGQPMGVWEAGRTVRASVVCSHHGDPPEAQLRFYGSKVPGLKGAVRGARWGRAAYPLVRLRVLGKGGAVLEEVPFSDSCPCAGGFAPELLVPSRVPPGAHQLVVRMFRLKPFGGPADFVYPVEVRNPGFGTPMKDPAYALLRARFGGKDVRFASLRRAEDDQGTGGSYPEERVSPARAWDNTMDTTNRDWDPRPVNYGSARLLKVGVSPHCHGDSRTLLKFDLSGFPKETEILGAAIRLTTVSGAYLRYGTGAKIEAYAVRRRWNEGQAKDGWSAWHGPLWFGKHGTRWGKGGCDDPKVDRFPEPAGSAEVGGFPKKLDANDKSRTAPVELRRLIALDVSKLVQTWHAGTLPNHGVLLRLNGPGNGRICSSEFLDFPYRPTLVIAYRGAGPGPTYHAAPGEDLARARIEAAHSNKPLVLQFYAAWCDVCKLVQKKTFADPAVKGVLARQFQLVRVDFDKHRDLAKQLGVDQVPALVVLKPDGETKLGAVAARLLRAPGTLLTALEKLRPKGR